MNSHVAIDLGASSGRVVAGIVEDEQVQLEELSRFPNEIVPIPASNNTAFYWDILRIWSEVLRSLRNMPHCDSIGVDTWGVDYGLLGPDGILLGAPRAYRDPRTHGIPDQVFEVIPSTKLYERNGLQRQDFNTLFQLVAETNSPSSSIGSASNLALLPDLLGFWLTGKLVCEITNASTTGLVNPETRSWDTSVLQVLGQVGPDVARLLPPLVEPGTVLGTTRDGLQLPNTTVVSVATHDTASAVAAVPAASDTFGYISCGTWSLVGTELSRPVLSQAAHDANFTNELGTDKRVRFLKNIMGLWIFNECFKEWRALSPTLTFEQLNGAMDETRAFRTLIDVNDPRFYPPGPMVDRIRSYAIQTDQPVPKNPPEYYRCIMESLALAYAQAITETQELSGISFDRVNLVGGGSLNGFLCQLTADATGLVVEAGPAEGTALGNILLQAQALGTISSDPCARRAVARRSSSTTSYFPKPHPSWRTAANRITERK